MGQILMKMYRSDNLYMHAVFPPRSRKKKIHVTLELGNFSRNQRSFSLDIKVRPVGLPKSTLGRKICISSRFSRETNGLIPSKLGLRKFHQIKLEGLS